MIDKGKHIPLYIQLKDEILDKIRNGTYEVDKQIPSEKVLMEEYGVGRATVREALSILVNEGYLYKKQGIGTFVARKQPSLGFEPLISHTYSLEARGIKSVNDVKEKKIITPDKELAHLLRWQSPKECLYLKRIRYADERPIAIEDSYFDGKVKKIDGKFDLNSSLAKIMLKDLKITITKIDQTVIPRVPTKEEQEILKIDDKILILDMERWMYIEGFKETFYYLKFIIPGNIYYFPQY